MHSDTKPVFGTKTACRLSKQYLQYSYTPQLASFIPKIVYTCSSQIALYMLLPCHFTGHRLLSASFQQLIHNRWVSQCGSVANILLLLAGNFPQNAPHDLARPGLGDTCRVCDCVGTCHSITHIQHHISSKLGVLEEGPSIANLACKQATQASATVPNWEMI